MDTYALREKANHLANFLLSFPGMGQDSFSI